MLQSQRSFKAPVSIMPFFAFGFLACATLAVIGLCIFYLTHSYNDLATWYLSLNDDLAHRPQWASRFFSPQTKSAGNIYCIAGMLVALPLLIWSLRRMTVRIPRRELSFSKKDILMAGLLTVVGVGLWYWGQDMAEVGPDEQYSAYYCAGVHPFQTLSYYMDPNNHVLYNLLNNLLFFWCPNKVWSGRILSLLAYLMLNGLLYRFMRHVTGSYLAAVLIALALALQFQILGFSLLARGYELYLLFHWIAFMACYRYFDTNDTRYLLRYVLTVAAGFLTVPTFLYFFITLSVAAAICQLLRRAVDYRFWGYTFVAILLTFLCYLPAILFSGVSAITANDFVRARNGLDWSFLYDRLTVVVQESFWINYPARQMFFGTLLLLPAVFLFRRSKRDLLLWLTGVLAWPVYFAIAVKMRHFAGMRNVIWQYHITLAGVLVSLYFLFKALSDRLKAARLTLIALALTCCALYVHFISFFRWQIDSALYGISTHQHNQEIVETLRTLPKGMSLACPDFTISWYYLAKAEGHPATVQPTGREDLLVVHDVDVPPRSPIAGYTFWKSQTYYFLYLRHGITPP